MTGHIIDQNCGENCGSISNVDIDGQVTFYNPVPTAGDTALITSLGIGGPAPQPSPASPGPVTYGRENSGLASPFTVSLGSQSVAVLGVTSASVGGPQINPALSLGGTFTATSDVDIGGYLTPIQISGSGTLTSPYMTLSGTVNVTGGTLHGDQFFIDNVNVIDPGAVGGGSATSTTATFTGSGAALTATNYLVVGDSTSGQLVLQSGASSSIQGGSGNLYIGNAAGSTGEIDVNSGSKLTTGGFAIVGDSGTGTLSVAGGQVQTGGVLVVGNGGSADGTLNITQGGKVTSDSGGAASSFAGIVATDSQSTIGSMSTGTVTIDGSGSMWDVKESLSIGPYGTGSVTVSNGGTLEVDGSDIYLGHNQSSSGSLVLDGAQSTLNAPNATLHVGYAGTGEVDVKNGATLNEGGMTMVVGDQSTGQGTISVTSGGIFNVANLTIGGSGSGEVDIGSAQNNGSLSAGTANITGSTLIIGRDQSSIGVLTVDGPSSVLNTSATIQVGLNGTGTIDLEDGVHTSLSNLTLGVNASGNGKLIVGDNAVLTTSGDLIVGTAGQAIFNVQNGGSATIGGDLTLGAMSSPNAVATIDGSNAGTTNAFGQTLGTSQLTVQGTVTLGQGAGQGQMSVLNGASLTVGENVDIGALNGTGSLTISGGSQVTIGHTLFLELPITGQAGISVDGSGTKVTVGSILAAEGTFVISNNATVTVLGGCGCVPVRVATSANNPSVELDVTNGATLSTPAMAVAGQSNGTPGENGGPSPTATVKVIQGGTINIAGMLGVSDGGTVDVTGGGGINLGTPGQQASSGQIAIGAGGKLGLVSPSFIDNDGTAVPNDAFVNGLANGTLPKVNGNVMLQSGGSASGVGIVNGNFTNFGGTIVAGDAPGPIVVNGNYVQGPSGVLALEIGPTSYSQLLVTGSATLNGTLQLLPVDGGALKLGQSLSLVFAENGINGSFTTLDSGSPFVNLNGSLVDGLLELTEVHAPGSFAAVATTPNQAAVANVLDQQAMVVTAGDLYNGINNLSNAGPAQVPAMLDTLSGEAYGDFAALDVEVAHVFGDVLQARISDAQNGTGGGVRLPIGLIGRNYQVAANSTTADAADLAPNVDKPSYGAWAEGLGGFAQLDGTGGAHTANFGTGGLMAGIDTEVLPGWLVGGAFGYAHTTLSAQNLASTGYADNYAFVLYSGVTRDSSYLNGAVGYIRDDGSLQRGLDLGGAPRTARGNPGANQVFGSVEAGRSWPTALGGSVTPFVRLDITSLEANGFSESGAGDFGLAVGSQNATSVQSVLGLKFTRDVDVGWGAPLAVSVKSGWGHEFESGANPVVAAFEGAPLSPFTVQAAHLDHDVAVVGVGVSWAKSASTSLFAKFEGQYGGLSRVSTATAGLRFAW